MSDEILYEEIAKNTELQKLKKDFLELQKKFVEYKEHTDTRIKDLELFIKSRNTSRNKSRHKFRITNFPIKYTQVKLYQYFAQFGAVDDISIVQSSNGYYYAYITYSGLEKRNELLYVNHILDTQSVKVELIR